MDKEVYRAVVECDRALMRLGRAGRVCYRAVKGYHRANKR